MEFTFDDVYLEEWHEVPIAGLGRYKVSSFGRLLGIRGEILAQHTTADRRLQVSLRDFVESKLKTYLVHRLVCMAFHPNSGQKPQVNHIDGDPSNNYADNLEWATAVENIRHSRDNLGNNRGTPSPVISIEPASGATKEYASMRDAVTDVGVLDSTVISRAIAKSTLAGGYFWRYVNPSRGESLPPEDDQIEIPGFSAYCLSVSGKIFSRRVKRRIGFVHSGYENVKLTGDDGVQVTKLAHRLVASIFHPNTYANKTYVNHKDGNKLNNHKDNLEWVTPSENSSHAIETGLNPCGQKVYVFKNGIMEAFASIAAAARFMGVGKTPARDTLHGLQHQCGDGYRLSFEPRDPGPSPSRNGRTVYVSRQKNGSVIATHNGITSTARSLKSSPSGVTQAIRDGCRCKGFYLSYDRPIGHDET